MLGKDGLRPGSREKLSGLPDYGRLCWPIAGTKYPTGPRGIHAQEIKDCETCEFFRAEIFDGMADS